MIRKKSVFEIAGFDDLETVAHVEICLKDGKIKAKQSGIETWAKMKYDRQIAAIAKTRRVGTIYSTDKDLYALSTKLDIPCVRLWDLPLPPPKQENLPLVDIACKSQGETQSPKTTHRAKAPNDSASEGSSGPIKNLTEKQRKYS